MTNVVEVMTKNRLVAVVRENDYETAKKISEAAIAGGIKLIEITFTIPNADKLITELTQAHKNDGVCVGAGTILDTETARIAILAGAQFIVSPTTDSSVTTLCHRYQICCACGAFTPNEVKYAMECGADMVKVFPATLCSPSYLKALHGPFPNVKFMVTGSMREDTILQWLNDGASVVGVGGILADPAHAGDYDTVTKNARKLVEIVTKE